MRAGLARRRRREAYILGAARAWFARALTRIENPEDAPPEVGRGGTGHPGCGGSLLARGRARAATLAGGRRSQPAGDHPRHPARRPPRLLRPRAPRARRASTASPRAGCASRRRPPSPPSRCPRTRRSSPGPSRPSTECGTTAGSTWATNRSPWRRRCAGAAIAREGSCPPSCWTPAGGSTRASTATSTSSTSPRTTRRGHGRHPAPGPRDRGRGPALAGGGPRAAVFRLGPPLRPARAVSAPRGVRLAVPGTASGAYDAEIAFTDVQVGRLLDALAADGRLDHTVVAVLADHGEMLGEHGEVTHGFFIYDAAVHIPLIVAGPACRPPWSTDQVRIVDVMPTVLELLGVPGPAAVQGVSLLPLARGRRSNLSPTRRAGSPLPLRLERARLHPGRPLQADPRAAARSSTTSRGSRGVGRPRRGATRGAWRRWSGRSTRWPGALASAQAPSARRPWTRRPRNGWRPSATSAGAVSARHLEDRPRGDPKDKIVLYNLLKDSAGASARAATTRRSPWWAGPSPPTPRSSRATCCWATSWARAAATRRRSPPTGGRSPSTPSTSESVFRLAVTYKDMGRLAEARVGFERAREIDPRNGKVLWQLADLDMRERRFDRARGPWRSAGPEDRGAAVPPEAGRVPHRGEALRRGGGRSRQGPGRRPGLETAHFNLGLVHEERGDLASDGGTRRSWPETPRPTAQLQPGQAPAEGRPHRARPPTASARPWPSRRSSGPAISTWPRRCSTWATSTAPSARPRRGCGSRRTRRSRPWATSCWPTSTTARAGSPRASARVDRREISRPASAAGTSSTARPGARVARRSRAG